MATLGIDFGTSNSAVGFAVNGVAQIVPLEGGAQTLPTSVFFDFEARKTLYGSPANAALIAGEEGRYMRALKSLLGTALMHEPRMILNEKQDFVTIIARFLATLKARAEAATGQTFTHALSGRPVFFHSSNEKRNAQALDDLTACYAAAGFKGVTFMPEPEAAALASKARLRTGDVGLVVDIGGGTSDFTVFRHSAGENIEILSSHGVRLGGTDFDRRLSLDHVMPLLGMGTEIRHAFGDQTHPAPRALFTDLATWQKIPFLYAPEPRRDAADLAKFAVEPALLDRLVTVLNIEVGHNIAFAVEAGKISANTPDELALPEINLGVVEKGLRVPLPAALMWAGLAEMSGQITDAARHAVHQAGMETDAIDQLILVGGSSLMGVVQRGLNDAFPRATLQEGAAMTGIVQGLALASETVP